MADVLPRDLRKIPVIAVVIDSGLTHFVEWGVIRDYCTHLLGCFTKEYSLSVTRCFLRDSRIFPNCHYHRDPVEDSSRTDLPIVLALLFSSTGSSLRTGFVNSRKARTDLECVVLGTPVGWAPSRAMPLPLRSHTLCSICTCDSVLTVVRCLTNSRAASIRSLKSSLFTYGTLLLGNRAVLKNSMDRRPLKTSHGRPSPLN
jgi:hypothetical protein